MPWLKLKRILRTPDARVTQFKDSTAELEIEGLFCGVCAMRVTNELNKLDGVESASCDLESATASVQLSGSVSEAELRQAVIDAAAGMPIRRAADRAARSVGL